VGATLERMTESPRSWREDEVGTCRLRCGGTPLETSLTPRPVTPPTGFFSARAAFQVNQVYALAAPTPIQKTMNLPARRERCICDRVAVRVIEAFVKASSTTEGGAGTGSPAPYFPFPGLWIQQGGELLRFGYNTGSVGALRRSHRGVSRHGNIGRRYSSAQ
jgi:hypothetical protein